MRKCDRYFTRSTCSNSSGPALYALREQHLVLAVLKSQVNVKP
jgi:hypothetical protein